MTRRLFAKLATMAAALAVAECAFAYAVEDAQGTHFEFEKSPRCATVVPAITQNIFAIGAGKYLVANSRYCDFPEEAKHRIKIGGYIDPDYEKIVSVKPEIFILPATSDSRVANRLRKLGIKCFILNGEGIANISADVRLLGKLFGLEESAEKTAAAFDSALKPDNSGGGRRAFFMFGRMAAGRGSFAGDLLNACGLANCADKIGRPWAEVPREFVLAANPEIIFAEYENEKSRAETERFFRTDSVWRTTSAVKNSRICFVPRDTVIVPSVRVAEALEIMRAFLQKN